MAHQTQPSAMTGDGPRPLTRKQRKLVDASAAIRTARPEQIDFLHTVQCQCGLPYRNPGDGVREWDRRQGFASLRIEAGSALDPSSREFVKLGLPYGEKPRLVLIHLASEATHREGEAVTAAIHSVRKERGQLKEERQFTRLVPLNLTEAERADPHSYAGGEVIQFVQHAKGHPAASRLVVANPTAVPVALAARFQVYRQEQLPLAEGDLIRLTAGGQATDGTRLSNGSTFTVTGFTAAGGIRLDSGKVLPAGFGHLTHGYVATSHASQGRTVDRVLIAQSADSLGASSREQFYVSASRGRESVWVYTKDRKALREQVERAERRVSATDLLPHRADGVLTRAVTFLSRLATLTRARAIHAIGQQRGREAELGLA